MRFRKLATAMGQLFKVSSILVNCLNLGGRKPFINVGKLIRTPCIVPVVQKLLILLVNIMAHYMLKSEVHIWRFNGSRISITEVKRFILEGKKLQIFIILVEMKLFGFVEILLQVNFITPERPEQI